MDIFDIIERKTSEILSGLEQEGLDGAFAEPVTRFFIDNEEVEFLEEKDLHKNWSISSEYALNALELEGVRDAAEKHGMTPFRQAMINVLEEQGEDAEAYWGVLVENSGGGTVEISECWSNGNSGMNTRLIDEQPLDEFAGLIDVIDDIPEDLASPPRAGA